MRQAGQRLRLIVSVYLGIGGVCTASAGAQTVPIERTLPPPVAEWSQGFTAITSIRELEGGATLAADRGEVRLYLVEWATGDHTEVLFADPRGHS